MQEGYVKQKKQHVIMADINESAITAKYPLMHCPICHAKANLVWDEFYYAQEGKDEYRIEKENFRVSCPTDYNSKFFDEEHNLFLSNASIETHHNVDEAVEAWNAYCMEVLEKRKVFRTVYPILSSLLFLSTLSVFLYEYMTGKWYPESLLSMAFVISIPIILFFWMTWGFKKEIRAFYLDVPTEIENGILGFLFQNEKEDYKDIIRERRRETAKRILEEQEFLKTHAPYLMRDNLKFFRMFPFFFLMRGYYYTKDGIEGGCMSALKYHPKRNIHENKKTMMLGDGTDNNMDLSYESEAHLLIRKMGELNQSMKHILHELKETSGNGKFDKKLRKRLAPLHQIAENILTYMMEHAEPDQIMRMRRFITYYHEQLIFFVTSYIKEKSRGAYVNEEMMQKMKGRLLDILSEMQVVYESAWTDLTKAKNTDLFAEMDVFQAEVHEMTRNQRIIGREREL